MPHWDSSTPGRPAVHLQTYSSRCQSQRLDFHTLGTRPLAWCISTVLNQLVELCLFMLALVTGHTHGGGGGEEGALAGQRCRGAAAHTMAGGGGFKAWRVHGCDVCVCYSPVATT